LKTTLWIYVNLLMAWTSMLVGLYSLSALISYMRQFSGSMLLNICEVLITVLLFLLWLFLWRFLTIKLFKNVITRNV
jgi:uncharacterized membrane protein